MIFTLLSSPPPDSEDEEDQLTLIRHHHDRLRCIDTKRIPSYPWNHIVNKYGAYPLSSQFEFEDWKNNNKQVWNQACLDHHLNFGDPSPWKTTNDRLHEEESRWRSFEMSVKDSSIALQCYLRDAFLERNRPAFDIVRICDRNDFKYFDPIVCSLATGLLLVDTTDKSAVVPRPAVMVAGGVLTGSMFDSSSLFSK